MKLGSGGHEAQLQNQLAAGVWGQWCEYRVGVGSGAAEEILEEPDHVHSQIHTPIHSEALPTESLAVASDLRSEGKA